MNKNIAKQLNECLNLLQCGTNLEAVLSQYPEHTAELRPLLQTVVLIRQVPRAVPSPEAKAAGRQGLLAAVEHKRQTRTRRDGFWRTVTLRLRTFLRIPEVFQRFP